jgi:small-conductance mechanosensitive channel
MEHLTHWKELLWSLGIAGGAVLIALVAHAIVFAFLKRLRRDRKNTFYEFFLQFEQGPTRLLLPLLAVTAVLPWVPLPPQIHPAVTHAAGLVLIGNVAWIIVALLDALQNYVSGRQAIDLADNLEARRLRTQVQVLRHIAVVVIILITLAIMLMTFPNIRHLGESLFASAGLAALVAGFAARTTLSSLFAGVQIALTQPIRLDDVVIVEGEWGWIEEITTTYVVVRVWDLRRLVVPLSYFIEKPFQNWTRRTANLLTTVFFYTDYTIPVDKVRDELHRVLDSSDQWDRKVWGLQVTNTTAHTMELRALMSASDGSRAFDLQCFVREKIIQFLQEKYPQCLPKTRAELQPVSGNEGRNDARNNVQHATA